MIILQGVVIYAQDSDKE